MSSYASMNNLTKPQTIALTSNIHFLKPNNSIYTDYSPPYSVIIKDDKINTQNCHCSPLCSDTCCCSPKGHVNCGK